MEWLEWPAPLPPAVRLNKAGNLRDTMAGVADETCTFVVVSDTHNNHGSLGVLPPGDVLLHCGDLTRGGSLGELADFAAWWHAQPHRQKVVIAGACAVGATAALTPRTHWRSLEATKQGVSCVHAS